MSFILGLFAAVSVQKNIRDLAMDTSEESHTYKDEVSSISSEIE
jgi:hypothetical protein